MIEIHNLTKSFGPHRALAGIDLTVRPGEFVLLVGPNGAGKTTLLRLLATLARPTSGTIHIGGFNTAEAGHTIRQHIGFLSHRTLLYDDLTAAQNLAYYARLYAIPDAPARIADLLERVNLTARRHDLVRTYSRGMQQRLAVTRAVLHRPKLLLLDEPYTGLDPLAADNLTALLNDIVEDGCTLLVTTHNLERTLIHQQRALILQRGRVVADVAHAGKDTLAHLYRQIITARPTSHCPPNPPTRPTSHCPKKTPVGATSRCPTPIIQLRAIVTKDITAELHTKEIVSAMFVFAVLALLIFSFALDLHGAVARAAAPGVLWTTIAFAGTLGLSRAMAREQQNGGLEGLLLAPIDRAAIFFGKAISNFALMVTVEIALVPLATLLFNVPLYKGSIVLILLLGTLGYAAVGTLLATIAINTRAREVMLPILLLPLIVPLLIGAVQATGGLLEGLHLAEVGHWTRLLIAYDLIMIAVSMVTFGYVVEE